MFHNFKLFLLPFFAIYDQKLDRYLLATNGLLYIYCNNDFTKPKSLYTHLNKMRIIDLSKKFQNIPKSDNMFKKVPQFTLRIL